MTTGTWVLGLLNGLTIGLLAVGLVLVYKSDRFLNLAHAQLGAVPALLLAKWTLDEGWNWWLAFVTAIIVGIATALVVERFLIRPVQRKNGSPVRLLLLSLGVSQLLLALTYIPGIGPKDSDAPVYPQPFTANVHIGGVVLNGMEVLTAILVPVIVVVLAVFMRYSITGKQIRAAANNRDAARLCGIAIGRVSAITWAIAGACAATSAVLAAPTQPNFNYATFGPYLLMVTLGAAALGAFVSLPLALVGGLVLGVVGQVVSAHTSNGSDGELAVFIAILLIVLLRGKAIARVFDLAGTVTEERAIVRIPASLKSSPLVRHYGAWMAALGLLVFAIWPLLPYFHSSGNEFLLSLVLIYAVLGVSLTMLLGWGGQVSLGQFAVVGLGAYTTARWQPHGLSIPVLFITVGLVGALSLVIIGLPALRVRGLTLAVTTLGFAVVSSDWLFHQSWAGSAQAFGLTVGSGRIARGLGHPGSQLSIYYLALVVLVLAFASGVVLRRSGPGRQIFAVKDNERASAAFGLTPSTIKMTVLAVSGFFAGVAGVLWAEAWRSVSPDQFSPDVSIALIALPVIGGMGSLGGAVVAAVVIYGGTFFVGPHVAGLFGSFGNNLGFNLFLAGILQISVLVRFPSGIAGEAQAVWQGYLDRRAERESGAETVPADAVPAAAAVPLAEVDPDEALVDSFVAAAASPTPVAAEVPDLVSAVPGVPDRAYGLRKSSRAVPTDADIPLRVQGVMVHFGGIVALNGPDIHVNAGEIVGLIGTNGAGKTTLMNVISGLISPSEGSVSLFGREVVDLPADLRASFGLSRSFQDARLFGSLTVTEALQVPLARRHRVSTVSAMVGAPWVRAAERETRQEAEVIGTRFGLSDWADIRTNELSTGTRRVCDLAAQVASRPKLLLLDEPTAGVAQREAEAFGPLLRQIRDELDCAILIVEHDMPLLMGLCDRIYALEAGAVIAEGDPEQIRSNPRVIASYLGGEEAAISRTGSIAPATSTTPASADE